MKPTSYIAKKEDFQKAVTDLGHLRVIAVYPDDKTTFDTLPGYIVRVTRKGANCWDVVTDGMNRDTSVSVILI